MDTSGRHAWQAGGSSEVGNHCTRGNDIGFGTRYATTFFATSVRWTLFLVHGTQVAVLQKQWSRGWHILRKLEEALEVVHIQWSVQHFTKYGWNILFYLASLTSFHTVVVAMLMAGDPGMADFLTETVDAALNNSLLLSICVSYHTGLEFELLIHERNFAALCYVEVQLYNQVKV